MSARVWRTVRQSIQLVALLLFLGLLVYVTAQRPQRFWADLFLRLDPLAMVTGSLAGRVLLSGLMLAAPVLLLTLLFGRVWCGWFCPLGTVLSWLGPRRVRWRPPAEGWRAWKYLLLTAVLVAAVFRNQSLLVFDPITILNRTAVAAAWPAIRSAVIAAEGFLYRFRSLGVALDWLHGALVVPVFQSVQPLFSLAPWIALFFVSLVALNLWAPRFWCRYLCPLGGMLGLLSRFSLLRRQVSGACAQCGSCTGQCPTGTINPRDGFRSDPGECVVCLDCMVDCPREAVGMRWKLPRWRPASSREYDPSRRQLLAAAGATLAGLALAGVEPITKRQPATLIRPPGAALTDFSALCIRCGACVRVCPTQGLQPSLFEGGVQNVMTPKLVPRLGFCNYGCNACGQVCPTGAVPKLALERKQHVTIGLASVDRDRCLPWAYGIPCIVCEEACPVPDKAIQLDQVEVPGPQEPSQSVQRPSVVKELCIGCGLCEFKCPTGGEAAIRVFVPTEAGNGPASVASA